MNGSYHYGYVNPNQPIPLPAAGMPFPPPGLAGIPFPPFPPMPPQQHNSSIDGHNYNVPPPMVVPEREHVNNGHLSVTYPPPPVIINQEIYVSSTGQRYYARYNGRLPEVNPGPVQYRTFVPQSNVPMFGRETPVLSEDFFSPLPSEIHPDYRAHPNPYGPRPDAVWAPNPGEMFTFGDMINTLPPPPPPMPLAAEQELEEGLQALERRIDTEFKNAD